MLNIKNNRPLVNNLVIASFIGLLISCGGADESEYVNRAKTYMASQELNAASLELKNALLKNGQNGEARYLLGKIELEIGDVSSAEKEIRRALEAGWDEAESKMLLGEALIRQAEYNKLLEEVQANVKFPETVRANILGLRAYAFSSLERWDDATEAVDAGESINQDASWLLLAKARIAIHNDDLAMAKETLLSALILYPDSKDLWLLSAGLSAEESDQEAVIAALQKVIDLDPPKMMTAWGRHARLGLFRVWFNKQDLKNARAAIDPVLETFVGDPEANYLGGLLSFSEGQFDQAEERLLKVIRVNPSHQEGLLLLGQLSYVQKDFQQAAYYLEQAGTLKQEDLGTQTLLGKTYLMLGQYSEAEDRLKLASAMAEDDAKLLALVGISRLKAGDTQAGIKDLEKAAAAAPKDTAVRSELARAYMSTGDIDNAINVLESGLDKNVQHHQTEALLLLAYLRAGMFDDVLELASNLSKQLPDSALPKNFIGIAYEGKKDYSSAADSYNTALQMDPDNSVSQLGLARLDLQEGNIEAARKRYENILKTETSNPQALLGLAKIIGQEGRVQDAMKLVEQAHIENKEALEPRIFLTEYFLQNNAPEKAEVTAQESLKIAPLDPRVLALLGRAQLGTGKGKEALTTLSTLIEVAPDWADSHYYLAQAQVYTGDLSAAHDSLIKATELDSDYIDAKLALGNLELRTGNTDKALKIARDLQKSKAYASSGYILEGDIYMRNKKPTEATGAYTKAFDLSPSNSVVLKLYFSKKSAGNIEAALNDLEDWLKTAPQDETIRYYLANAYQVKGDVDRAVAEYEKILEQNPDNGAVLNNLAWLYYQEKNEKQRALELSKRAFQLHPKSAAILDTYGWLLVENGSLEQGLGVLHKAAAGAEGNRSIRYHLAVAIARTGDKTGAIEELETILESGEFPEKEKATMLLQELK